MNKFITCSVCGSPLSLTKEVSESNYIHCPCCCSTIANPLRYGQIVQESNKMFNNGCLITIGIIVLLAIIGSLADDYDVNSDVRNSDFDASVHQVERHLENTLKDPDSYDGMEWSAVQEAPAGQDYKYYVRHKYRAKNSFGGYVIENKVFYLDEKGNVVGSQ